MFMILVDIIVWMLILGVLYWITTLFPKPDVVAKVIMACFVLLALLVVLSAFGLINSGMPHIRL